MKRLFLMLLISLCINSYAINLTPEHTNYYEKIKTDLRTSAKEKNNARTVDLQYQLIGFINSLPEKEMSKKEKESTQGMLYYDLACFLARTGNNNDAIDAFARAVEMGYNDYSWATKDTDLNPLRNDSNFQKQIKILGDKWDYDTILRNSGNYTTASEKELPNFTYLDRNDPQMVYLRKSLNLDSISGRGDQISKIKNLLHYIHTTVRHDGNSQNPKKKNTLDLIKVCKDENRGVNCRMMATMLAECYMAIGMPARILTCLPKSDMDQDCHVITVVWNKKLNRWIWADPTYDVMIYNDKNVPIGPREVREAFMAGKDNTVNMSENANWNGQKTGKDMYYNYMKKNLYWLQSPLTNGFDIETNRGNTYYLNLCTVSFKPWSNDYLTNSDTYFWQSPYSKKK